MRRATAFIMTIITCIALFLSTLSLRRATIKGKDKPTQSKHFYPRSPCGERPRTGLTCGDGRNISIHALLAESDLTISTIIQIPLDFYPRSPCGERLYLIVLLIRGALFLSTLSLRRATASEGAVAGYQIISIHALLAESDANWFDLWGWAEYFYPRSPCGERHLRVVDGSKSSIISIHALLAESDAFIMTIITCIASFLSTLSLRRATEPSENVKSSP